MVSFEDLIRPSFRDFPSGGAFGFGLSCFGYTGYLRLIVRAQVATTVPEIRMGRVDITVSSYYPRKEHIERSEDRVAKLYASHKYVTK